MPLRKWQLKQEWAVIIYSSECPKSEILTESNADEDVKQQKLSHIAGGNAKWYNHFGKQFDGFL